MDRELTHPDDQPDIERVLSHYSLGELVSAQRVERGYINEHWIVRTDRGRYFLKRRHPTLSHLDVVLAQHALLKWLNETGFPAPSTQPTSADQTYLELQGRLYEIQEYLEGSPYDHERQEHMQEAARVLGVYHVSVQGFDPPALRKTIDLYSPSIARTALANLIETWTPATGSKLLTIVRELETHTADLEDRFARHINLPHVVIHGDYYAGNLLFDGDRIVGVVDFDKAQCQPRVVELAEALIYFASPHPGNLIHLVYPGVLQWKQFELFSEGYARTVDTTEMEALALPDYVRCIWLQISLQRLLEKGYQRDTAPESLQEVLELASWAQENRQRMADIIRRAAHRRTRGH